MRVGEAEQGWVRVVALTVGVWEEKGESDEMGEEEKRDVSE